MGDRRNVKVVEEGGGVINLYTHWGGYDLPQAVQAALSRRWRWDDESYLTRIIFDEMSLGQHGNETGFGISTWAAGDAGYPPVEIHMASQEVVIGDERWTFEEFLGVDFEEREGT